MKATSAAKRACAAICCVVMVTAAVVSASDEDVANGRDRHGYSRVRLANTPARTMAYRHHGRIQCLFGEAFSHGESPEASAAAFLEANHRLLGVRADDLRLTRLQPIAYRRETGDYKLTGVFFDQHRDGVPVFGGRLNLTVRNEAGYPLVYASSALRDVGDFTPPLDLVPQNNTAGRRSASELVPGLVNFGPSRLVIWAGVRDMVVEPVLGHEFHADTGNRSAPDYGRWLFLTDARTGGVLHHADQLMHVDITGSVKGHRSVDPHPHECSGVVAVPMPYARVNTPPPLSPSGPSLGQTVTYADENGDFVLPNAGTMDVTVQSAVRGLYFRVFNAAGPDSLLSEVVTPPGPVDFLHNEPNTDPFQLAEVNAYIAGNVAREFVLAADPGYPRVSTELEFPIHVNETASCNGSYDAGDHSIHVGKAAFGCPNWGFATVIQHEYGHHLVNSAGFLTGTQGEYGEGLGDSIAALINDEPLLFLWDCKGPNRRADNDCQYLEQGCSTCGAPLHNCGMLLSGCVWSTRAELAEAYPLTFRDIIRDLTVASILLHTDGTITPAVTVEFLTVDDDNGNIFDGTPHYDEISAGFGAHDMPAPPLVVLDFEYPDGRPEIADPGSATSFPVNVIDSAAEAQDDSGVLHYTVSGSSFDVPMVRLAEDQYLATFPAGLACNAVIKWHVSALTTDEVVVTDPLDAPIERYQTVVASGPGAITFSDDFEDDTGWSTTSTANEGAWDRAIPAGYDRGDPPEDADGSGTAYVTGEDEDEDIDGGIVTLTSPTLDATGGNAAVSYHRWYSNDFGSDPNEDTFFVRVSDDDGATWHDLETIGPDGPGTSGGWIHVTHYVGELAGFALNDEFRVQFEASDLGGTSVVEAAVDGVQLEVFDCVPAPAGTVRLLDVLAAFGRCGACPEDQNGDGVVDGDDVLTVLQALGAQW